MGVCVCGKRGRGGGGCNNFILGTLYHMCNPESLSMKCYFSMYMHEIAVPISQSSQCN